MAISGSDRRGRPKKGEPKNIKGFDPGALADFLSLNFKTQDIEKEIFKTDWKKYQGKPELFCVNELDMHVTEDMKKLMSSVMKYRITIAVSANAVGKSHLASALALWFYRSYTGSQVIACSAPPERNLRENIFAKIRQFTRQNPALVEDDKVLSLKIVPKNAADSDDDDLKLESAILGITIPTAGDAELQATRISGYHAPSQLFIFDEGDGIPDGIYKGAEGCLSGDFSRLLILFNPKSKSGAAYRMIKNGLANVVYLSAFNHPNVISGDDVIPGAVSREKTVQRINDWTRALRKGELPDQTSCFEVPKFLEGTTAKSGAGKKYPPLQPGWRRIEEACFSYIVLGQYPAQGSNQLISQEWIDAARSRWDLYTATYGNKTPEGVRPLLGMDVADEGGDYNTIVTSYGNYIAPLEKWRGMDVDMSSTRASVYYAELNAYQINVESDGLGASVAPKMGRQFYWFCPICGETVFETNYPKCPSCRLENDKRPEMDKVYINAQKIVVGTKSNKKCELGQFGCLRDELWWQTREWLRTDQAMLPPDQDLIEELTVVTYGVVEGKIKITPSKIIREKLGRSADSASALIQTRYQGMGRPRISNLLD